MIPFKKRNFKSIVNAFIEGKDISSVTEFLCAMGEATFGPGGYMGQCLMGFEDCFYGGFGEFNLKTLTWKDFDQSKKHLTEESIEIIISTLEKNSITVIKD